MTKLPGPEQSELMMNTKVGINKAIYKLNMI